MDLFENDSTENLNLLHQDGIVNYYGPMMPPTKAVDFMQILMEEIDWQPDEVVIFGKKHITKRKVGWYGDKPFCYRYSNSKKVALPWSEALISLKKMVEERCGETFNSCLLNLYHNGAEGMGWHADDERELQKHGAIASISFGAERKFTFKHKQTKETKSIVLENGSLLVMKGTTQDHWLHTLPKALKITTPRINLTFRSFGGL